MSTLTVTEKRCIACYSYRPASEFVSERGRGDGERCASCYAERLATLKAKKNSSEVRRRQRRSAEDPQYGEHRRALIRRWNVEHPEALREYSARRRARKVAAPADDHTTAELYASWEERGLYGCAYCGAPWEHVEHVIPLVREGAHTVGNLVPACAPCNLSKGAKTLDEWRPDLAALAPCGGAA